MTSTEQGVLLLGGPTASGKTDFAIALAERYDAEIIGADSRQIYRDMPIGTAAPSPEQLRRVRHHLIAFVDPHERYSAARYVFDAALVLADIRARGKRAIVAGGSGFYLRALTGEVALAAPPDAAIRSRLEYEARLHPVDVLHEWLAARNPQRAATISPRDPYRIVRALEIDLSADRDLTPATPPAALPTLRATTLSYRKVALRCDPAGLALRIAARTDAMLAAGLVAEAERVGTAAIAATAVGYPDALAYTRGWLSAAELREHLVRATRHYAKRQQTWFRAEPEIDFIDSGDVAAAAEIVETLGWRAG